MSETKYKFHSPLPVMAIVVSMLVISEQSFSASMSVERAPSGSIYNIKFLDAKGNVTKKIESGDVEIKQIDYPAQVTGEKLTDIPRKSISLLAGFNYALVSETVAFANNRSTFQVTGRPYYLKSKVTLYDVSATPVMLFTDLDCIPVALSESGSRFACLYMPPAIGSFGPNAPAELTQDILHVYDTKKNVVLKTIDAAWSIKRVMLSPDGKWLVYTGRAENPAEKVKVMIFNLRLEQSITSVRLSEKANDGYTKINDAGNLIRDNYEWYKDVDSIWKRRTSGKTILYQAEH